MIKFNIVDNSDSIGVNIKEDTNNVSTNISGIDFVSIGGVADYEKLKNKPSINDVTLEGNKTIEEIGIESISNFEIEEIFNNIFK